MLVNINDLRKVPGIGVKTIQRIKEMLLEKETFISKYDPLLHLDENSINQGDCLELMNGIKDKSVDMILADLPYGTTDCSWDSIIDLDKLWSHYARIIKDNGVIVLTASQSFTTELINSNLEMFRYEWIWVKSNSTGFQLANKMPLKKHENILVFYRNLPTYNPQGLKIYGKVNKRGKVGNGGYLANECNRYIQKFTNYPTTILNFDYDVEKYHPTQKPVALFEYFIKTYTNEGDLVLDNVAGSGTTGVACINTNRRFILIEKEEKYVQIMKKRLEEALKNKNI